MSSRTYRIIELVGTSPKASNRPSATASSAPQQRCATWTGFEVTQIRGHVQNDGVEHFQVGLKVGFRMEDE